MLFVYRVVNVRRSMDDSDACRSLLTSLIVIQRYPQPGRQAASSMRPPNKLPSRRECSTSHQSTARREPLTHPTPSSTLPSSEQDKRMCLRTPLEDSGPGASCCAPAKHSYYQFLPSLVATGVEHDNLLSKPREYLYERRPGAERRQ